MTYLPRNVITFLFYRYLSTFIRSSVLLTHDRVYKHTHFIVHYSLTHRHSPSDVKISNIVRVNTQCLRIGYDGEAITAPLTNDCRDAQRSILMIPSVSCCNMIIMVGNLQKYTTVTSVELSYRSST